MLCLDLIVIKTRVLDAQIGEKVRMFSFLSATQIKTQKRSVLYMPGLKGAKRIHKAP